MKRYLVFNGLSAFSFLELLLLLKFHRDQTFGLSRATFEFFKLSLFVPPVCNLKFEDIENFILPLFFYFV